MNAASDPIKHVVLLLLENHSFDEMLGCFQAKYPDLDGVDPSVPRSNPDLAGKLHYQRPKTNYAMRLDPQHEVANVAQQMAGGNQGFVRNFCALHAADRPTDEDCAELMGYYPRGFLPALHGLAEDFTICDRYFSSLPGPTWPNRFFALSGTAMGRTEMPDGLKHPHLESILAQTQPTIFSRLAEKGRSSRIYYYDFPNSLIFKVQRTPERLADYRSIEEFFAQATKPGAPEPFPDFTFIEPKYFGIDQNDDHPPHNIMKAEKLIADVYNALRSNDALWQQTLLIVTFDEHGGFYDHAIPPLAPAPDAHCEDYDFRQYGIRVPTLLVSPWVARGVDHTEYDHTSILAYLSEKWNLDDLGLRTKSANSIGSAVLSVPRAEIDTVPCLRVPFSSLIQPDGYVPGISNGHQDAIRWLAATLDYEAGDLPSILASRAVSKVSGLARYGERLKAWLARKLASAAKALQASAERDEATRIEALSAIARRLILRGR